MHIHTLLSNYDLAIFHFPFWFRLLSLHVMWAASQGGSLQIDFRKHQGHGATVDIILVSVSISIPHSLRVLCKLQPPLGCIMICE